MIKQQLLRSILRSENAYAQYLENKRYHQALRIYKANQVIYHLLCGYSLDCNDEVLNSVLNYIFHLEDWFAQFEKLKKSNPNLEDPFVFEKLEHGIPYPKEFKSTLKNQ